MNEELLWERPLIDVSPQPGVSVMACDIMALESDDLFYFAMERVSEQRRAAIVGMKNRMAQNLRLGATLLLDRLLRRHGLHECDMVYGEGEHGKPFFANCQHLAFNLSHSGTMAAAALMPVPLVTYGADMWRHADGKALQVRQLGVDIQQRTRVRERLADCVFSDAEVAQIQADAHPDQAFTRLWARHESHVKATGEGVNRPLPPIPADAILHEYEVGGYSLSLCLI